MQNTYQEKILDLETTNNAPRIKLEGGKRFKIKSDFQPAGDQPEAIKTLTQNLKLNLILSPQVINLRPLKN